MIGPIRHFRLKKMRKNNQHCENCAHGTNRFTCWRPSPEWDYTCGHMVDRFNPVLKQVVVGTSKCKWALKEE